VLLAKLELLLSRFVIETELDNETTPVPTVFYTLITTPIYNQLIAICQPKLSQNSQLPTLQQSLALSFISLSSV